MVHRSLGDPDRLAGRAADVLTYDGVVDLPDLIEIEFAGQHDDIGKLGVETQGFGIGDRQLRGDMDFQTDFAAVHYRRHVGSDDRVHSCGGGCIQGLAHRLEILLIEDYVEGHVALDPGLAADAHDLGKVFRAEIVCRVAAHIQMPHPEVDGVRSALYGRVQTFEIARRSHYFQFITFHGRKITLFSGIRQQQHRAPPPWR